MGNHAKSVVAWIFGLVACVLASESDFVEELVSVMGYCAVMKPGTKLLQPGSCTNWIKCPGSDDNNANYEEGSCLLGLYFNKDTETCEPAEAVKCPYEHQSQNRCVGHEGEFLSNPKNCSAYIYCRNGEEFHSNCRLGLVFDPENSACVYEENYRCTEQHAEPYPLCLFTRDNFYFADEFSCETYHSCQNGELKTLTCSQGEGYDYLKGACLPKETATCVPTAIDTKHCGTAENPRVGYFSDETSCSGYYFCKALEKGAFDREPVFANCPNGFFFDKETLSCRDRLNVQCAHDRCEGMGNKYVNIAGDCSSYARCDQNKLASTGKCPEKYFFDEKTQGCTQQKIHYAACSAKQQPAELSELLAVI